VCLAGQVALVPLEKFDSACINVISLASFGRSSGTGGLQNPTFDPTVGIDNATAVINPVMAGVNHAPVSMAASDMQNRKRNVTMAGIDSSPGSIDEAEDIDGRDDKRRQPVKRACNECRQQKVCAAQIARRHATLLDICPSGDDDWFRSFPNKNNPLN
jgi:hypothetical protein